MKLLSCLLACILSCCVSASPSYVANLDLERTVVLNGIVNKGVINLSTKMQEIANQEYTDGTRVGGAEPLNVIINSPGGSTMAGSYLISTMEDIQGRGIQIDCYVTGLAASMAYQILLHCSNRYALPSSQILWHRARIQLGGGIFSPPVVLTAPLALSLAQELAYVDSVLEEDMLRHMPGDKDTILWHYERETIHTATQVNLISPNFLTIVKSMGNVNELIREKKVPKLNDPQQLDNKLAIGEIIYIWSDYDN